MSEGRPVGRFWPTPEEELLLEATLSPDAAGRKAWDKLRTRFDTQPIDHEWYQILPLLSSSLASRQPDDSHLPELRALYRLTWCKNQLRLSALADAVTSLHRVGIETLVLKGAALAIQVYGRIGHRPMSDVDLLVPTDGADAALQVLEGCGWQRKARPQRHAVALGRDDGQELDLHRHVAREFILADEASSSDDFWQRSVTLDVAGVHTRALDPADMLLHVCVHGTHADSNSRLRWVADGVTLLRAATPDWARLLEQAHRRAVVLPMRETLTYLVQRFGATVPADVLQELSRAPVTRGDRAAYRARSRPVPSRGPLRPVRIMWRACLNEAGPRSLPAAVAAAPRVLQQAWGAEQRRKVPVLAVKRGVRTTLGGDPT